MRFPMTTGLAVKLTTLLSLAVVGVTVPIPWALATFGTAPWALAAGTSLVAWGVPLVLLVTVLLAPRAVRVERDAVVVERLAFPGYRIPLGEVSAVEQGPELKALSGEVMRVAGNGGLMGFTGYFRVRGLGVVRCWATRLGRPTVLLRRRSERPVLLGVDDPSALLAALTRRVASR